MPGPVSTGSMVRTLPGAFLPCAEQYGHHDDRDDHGSHGDHHCGDHDLVQPAREARGPEGPAR